MKIRNSSRIMALVLALMMIVPLISIPAFAATGATKVDGSKAEPLLSQDFEQYKIDTSATGSGKPLSSGPSNVEIYNFNGNKVLKYDITPSTTATKGQYFINVGKTLNDFVAVTPTLGSDGKYSGSFTFNKVNYTFKEAVLNENYMDTACEVYTEDGAKYTEKACYLTTAAVYNAAWGDTNIAKPSWVTGTNEGIKGNYFVFSADYYFDTNISNSGWDVRMKTTKGEVHFADITTTDAGVTVKLHGNLTTKVKNGSLTVPKGEWFTLTVVAESAGNSTSSVTLYVNGELVAYGYHNAAFTQLDGNGWNLGHVRRGSVVSAYYGNYYVDNLKVYNTREAIPAEWEVPAVASNDFEAYNKGDNGKTVGALTNASNGYVTIDELNGNKVLKWDMTPVTYHANGEYFINIDANKDKWYNATATKNADGTYSGTANNGKYTFSNVTLNTNYASTKCTLYENGTAVSGNFYLTTAQVCNAFLGNTNVAQPTYVSVGANLKSDYFAFSADYYFETDITNRSWDVRMLNQAGKTVEFGTLSTTTNGVTFALKTNTTTSIYKNAAVIAPKGEWFNLTIVAESGASSSKITVYINGKIACIGENTVAFTGTNGNGWNLGHVQRGGKVSDYSGCYYVDNYKVYTTRTAIPANWGAEYEPGLIMKEEFKTTSFPSTITWGGSQKEILTANGNNYLNLDTSLSGNQDKPITVTTGAISGGFLQIDTDYYIPSDAQFGFQGQFSSLTGDRSSVPNGTGDVKQAAAISWVDLYYIKVSAGRAWISGLGDFSATANAYDEMVNAELPTDRFFTLSTIIDMATGKVGFFVDGKLAGSMYLYRTDGFMSNLSVADKKLLVAKINKLGTGGFTSFSGSLGVDNIVVKKVDPDEPVKGSLVTNDMESYLKEKPALGNGLVGAPSNTIVTTVGGNTFLKYDLTPDTTHKDGSFFINNGGGRDSWYNATVTKNADGTYSGTANNGKYTFSNVTLNTNYASTKCTLYENGTAVSGNFYLCTAQVRNAMQGQTNIAVASYTGGTLTGTTLVLSADYYFEKTIANKTFDLQFVNQSGATIPVAHLKTTANGVTATLHDNDEVKNYNVGATAPKGEWFTLTVVLECVGSNTVITIYVNGKLAAHGSKANTFTGSNGKGFNLGHVQRGGTVESYSGTYYVDNVSVYGTKDVIPADFDETLISENFNASTSIPSTIAYGGSIKEIVNFGGSNAFKIDVNAGNNASHGNIDKPLTVQNGEISGMTVAIDVDYYIPVGSHYGFQGQFSSVKASSASTLGGTAGSAATVQWVDLYFIRAHGDTASISFGGGEGTTYSTAIPMGKTFTLSTVIDLVSGRRTIYLDGVMMVDTYLYRDGYGYLSNITIPAKTILMAKLNKFNTSDISSYSGDLYVDNISVKRAFEFPAFVESSSVVDFENFSNSLGMQANAPSNLPTVAPSTAKYADLLGNTAVQISMQGQTEAEKLANPFVTLNSRSYDIINKVDSFKAPAQVTLDFLNTLTMTGSINNASNDYPIYYAYVESEGKVYVYNNNGAVATDKNIGGFTLSTFTIGEANYNAMYRAMCGGKDSNIDKNFRVQHPALNREGTYVMTADYFVANDAAGTIQAQSYGLAQGNKWIDLYQIKLTDKTFYPLNGSTAGKGGQKLIVDEWNTVTMIVTVSKDLKTSIDFYINGVYAFTKDLDYYIEADSWILAKIAKPSLAAAQQLAGYIYVDNIKVNAEKYNAENVKKLDVTKVLGFDIDGKTNVVNVDTGEAQFYVRDSIVAYGEDRLNVMFDGVVSTEMKASIRLGSPTGLRFATLIDVGMIARIEQMIAAGQIASYTYGTLIAPMDDGYNGSAGKELTFEDLVVGVTVLDIEADLGQFFAADDDDSTTHFVGSIVNIHESNMDRAFSGRGYLTITLMNGEVVRFYSESIMEISVADQAQKTLDANIYEEGTNAYETLVNFASYNK